MDDIYQIILKVANEEQVTDVQLEVFKREIKRRGEENEKSLSLTEVMDEAQSKAEMLLQALNSKWDNLGEIKNPYNLAKVRIVHVQFIKGNTGSEN